MCCNICLRSYFFSPRIFAAIGLRSGSCFTGQLPGIGTVFILASLRQSPLTNQGGCGGSRLGSVGSRGSWSLRDGGS